METNNGAKVSLNSIKSLFDNSWKLYQERFAVLSQIVLLPTLIIILGYTIDVLGAPFSIVGALLLLIGYITLVFSSLALIFSIHNNAGVDASYRASANFFWPFVWMSILSLFAFIGGSIMLIIPGIWLAVALTLRSYVLVIENRHGMDALRQSKDYVNGYWWAIVGRTLLMVILFLIISVILHLPFGLIGGSFGTNIASAIFILLITPFSSIFYYKIYENLRTLKPHLHGAQVSGSTFVKVSTIIGVVVAILLIIVAVVAIVYAVHHPMGGNMFMNNSWHYRMSNQ